MYKLILLASIAGLVSAKPQVPPSPVLLTTTKAGVVPVAPTPFNGLETLEGALIDGGPPLPGFIGPGGTATVQSNLPAGTYSAVLPSMNFDNLTGSTIMGTVVGSAMQGGQGVMFNISFTGLPDAAMYGPFVYHIHEMPIANGNCTTSLGHLDPTNRGELHGCEVAKPETCQVGDLAGKHGNITTSTFSATYTDPYLSTDPNSSYFFGNRSIVIHSKNVTRLACANFAMGTNGSSTGTNTSSSGTASPSTVSSNVASGFNCLSSSAYAMIMVAVLAHLV